MFSAQRPSSPVAAKWRSEHPAQSALSHVTRLLSLEKALLLAICLVPIVIYVPFLREPFERDEGAYSVIANGLLHGSLPYRDLFDHKLPVIYVWYAISFLLFGKDIEAPRLIASIVWGATTWFVFLETNLVADKKCAYAAALIFALSRGIVMLDAMSNTEAFLLLPSTAALYFFTRSIETHSTKSLFGVGLLLGLATCTKEVAIWQIFAACVVLGLVYLPRRRFAPFGQSIAAMGLGALVAPALILFPYVLNGSMKDFIYSNVTYNGLYADEVTAHQNIVNFIKGTNHFFYATAPLILASIVGFVLLLIRKTSIQQVVLMAWSVACIFGVMTGGRYFAHYYVQLLPEMAILSAIGYFQLRTRGGLKLAFTCALASLFVVAAGTNASIYLQPTQAAKHYNKFPGALAQREVDSRDVGLEVARLTTPNETVFEYGRESQIFFYADRSPAVRYFYDRPYWLDRDTLTETVKAVEAARPSLIVATSEQDPKMKRSDSFSQFVSANYDFVETVHFANIYRLKSE